MTAPAALRRHRFTVDDVHAMIRAGVLEEGGPEELIDGELVVMESQGPDHVTGVQDIGDWLREAYCDGYDLRQDSPIDCGPYDQPEPDLAVVRGSRDDYRKRHPRAAEDVVLVVEKVVTTHAEARAKAALYGRSGVPVYWLLDDPGRRLEVHTRPGPEGYGVVTVLAESEEVALPEGKGRWRVRDLLPSAL